MLQPENLPTDFGERNHRLISGLATRLNNHGDNAQAAFKAPFFWPENSNCTMRALRIPMVKKSRGKLAVVVPPEKTPTTTYKPVKLTDLDLSKLTEAKLGAQYYRRNQVLIDALRERLKQFDDNGKEAFKSEFRKPIHNRSRPNGQEKPDCGPIVRTIKLPATLESGLHVRGGVAGLGTMLRTDVYWTGTTYYFKPQYKADEDRMVAIPEAPSIATPLFTLRINDLIEVILKDGTRIFGYLVMHEANDGRLQVRNHDRPGKGKHKPLDNLPQEGDAQTSIGAEPDLTLRRFGINSVRLLRKFKVGILGDYTEVATRAPHGLA